jgi:hypothetical protein
VNEVRFQVVRLMRMLVQVCQTLDQVPDEVRPGDAWLKNEKPA